MGNSRANSSSCFYFWLLFGYYSQNENSVYILGCGGTWEFGKVSQRTGHSQGLSEEFKSCLRVAIVADTFLECYKGASNGFLGQKLLFIYLSLTYLSTSWTISEDK